MKKMIIRADDVGFTPVCNIGAFHAIENGLVTSVDVMLDCPGTEDALLRLREMPWLSVGWHMHMWGTPVSNPEDVSTLIEKDGPFAGRFRTDLYQSDAVDFSQALREARAQVERCIAILGRAPDTAGFGNRTSPFACACRQIMEEYGIAFDYAGREGSSPVVMEKINKARDKGEAWAQYYPAQPRLATQPAPQWADRNILIADSMLAYLDLYTDSVSEVEANYDPVLYYTQDRAGLLNYSDDVIVQQSWHPGYVDYFVYRLGERANRPRAQQFVVGRVQDVQALCDERLKNWVRENGIELVNLRDALYGTKEYQTHLRHIGSDLLAR